MRRIGKPTSTYEVQTQRTSVGVSHRKRSSFQVDQTRGQRGVAVSAPCQGPMRLLVLPPTSTECDGRVSLSRHAACLTLTSLRHGTKLDLMSNDLAGAQSDIEAARRDCRRLRNETLAKDKKIDELHETCDKYQSDSIGSAELLKETNAKIKSLKSEDAILKARNVHLEGEASKYALSYSCSHAYRRLFRQQAEQQELDQKLKEAQVGLRDAVKRADAADAMASSRNEVKQRQIRSCDGVLTMSPDDLGP